jgi:hypothetical protein
MEPNPYSVDGLIKIKGLEVEIMNKIIAMMVNNTFIVYSSSGLRKCEGSTFSIRLTYVHKKGVNINLKMLGFVYFHTISI